MKKLQNYFIREVLHTMLTMMLVFLGIMVSVVFIKYLSLAASGEMSIENAMAMLGIILPNFINLLIPITLFLALVVTINRLLHDNEMLIAFSAGVGWTTLVKWFLWPGFLLALISTFLSFWVVPKMNYYQDNLLQISSQNASMMSFFQTGRFFATGPNHNQVVYVENVNLKTGQSNNIFIYRKIGDTTELILAPTGTLSARDKLSTLQLSNGHEYKAQIGSLAYQMVHFANFTLLLIPNYNTNYQDLSTIGTQKLIKDKSPSSLLELEWRSATPLTTLVLSILGVLLGDIRPRKSKYLYFVFGIGIFIVYFNSLSIARAMVMNHALGLLPGLYLVHFIFLIFALTLLLKHEFLFSIAHRPKRRKRGP